MGLVDRIADRVLPVINLVAPVHLSAAFIAGQGDWQVDSRPNFVYGQL